MRSRPIFSFCAISIVLGISSFLPANVARADVAPAWELTSIDGKTVKLSDFKNKVVILDFWVTWFPPSRRKISYLVELQNQYQSQGLVVVGVSLDQNPEAVSSFAKQQNINFNYPIVMESGSVAERYGVPGMTPATFVIDPEGNIVSKHLGIADKSVLEDEITPLLLTVPK